MGGWESGIFESTATGNLVQANRIGTTIAPADFGNGGDGVHISFTASNNTIGGGPSAGNVIAFNTGRGINVVSGTGNRLSANTIFANDLIGIDLANNGVTPNDAGDGDAGANNLQNFPVLTSAIRERNRGHGAGHAQQHAEYHVRGGDLRRRCGSDGFRRGS